MSIYKKIIILALILFGIPSISLGSSFVSSLIQGKTPAEAIQIIAEQLDTLFGRVQTLETQQTETTKNIEQTNLEIERLKLENENLSKETERISVQVIENEKAIDLVRRCETIEKPRACAQKSIEFGNKEIATPDLPPSAFLSEVISAMSGGSWYAKNNTDEICWKFNGWKEDLSAGEKCRSRETYINSFNQDQAERRRQAGLYIEQSQEILKSTQTEFDELQCDVYLKKYAPNRKEPGCA